MPDLEPRAPTTPLSAPDLDALAAAPGRLMCITGASSGIGAATAVVAARAGWRIVVTYSVNAAGADTTLASVTAAGGRGIAVRADVSREADVLALFTVLDAAGGVDAFVNNAGVAPGYGPFEALTADDLTRTWDVNITGPFLCAREAVRRMSTRTGGRGGAIVNVTSKAAVLGGANEWVHYAASKAAIETMTVGLAKEVAPQGVRVNAVRPGLIAGGFGPWDPPGRVDAMRPMIPMQREGRPDEIAAAIVWLASDDASYVTGALLDVTGGR